MKSLVAFMVVAASTGPAHDVSSVTQELRTIESAQYRNQVDALRVDYQSQAQQQPNDVMTRVYIAWCSMVSDDAWNQFKNIAQIHPDNPWAHYGMGRVYTAWKMGDQARTEFEAALKKNPRFSPAMTGLADLLRVQQAWGAAESKYREALAITNDPQAHAGLGLALLEQQKPAEAKRELLAAITGWPDQPAALAALIKLLAADKDPNLIEATARLVDLRPRDREIRRQLADLRFEAGETEAAIADYERLLKLGNPDPMVVRRLIGEYRQRNKVEAEQSMQVVLAGLERDDPAPVLRLAELKLGQNDLEGAQAQYLAALERDPNRAQTLVELAKLRVRMNALFEALEFYRRASKLEGPAADEAKAEVVRIEGEVKLPKKPAKGSVDAIYNAAAGSLQAVYAERRRVKPDLAGDLKLRVRVAADGVVQGVDVVGDTVGDPVLTAHAYFVLRDATFEKRKREPVFEFELGKKSK